MSACRRSIAAALAATIAIAPHVAATIAAQTGRSTQAVPRRVILVGLDGADWLAIDPLIEAGRLPTFARLKAAGRVGTLVSTPPFISPIIWTTIATGRQPEDHGVLDFMMDLASGGQAPVSSASRRVPALWNVFSDAGKRVGVIGWWATWPAEDVRGTIVSDRVAPQLVQPEPTLDRLAILPASAARALSATIVRPFGLTQADLTPYVPLASAEYRSAMASLRAPASRVYGDPIAHLAASVASTRTYSSMAEVIARTERPDLLLVYLEAIDTISHLFVRQRRGQTAIERAYRDADALIGRLASAASPDTLIIVCSDHGFYPPDAGVAEDPSDLTGPATAWHRPYGIVAAAEAGALAGAADAGPEGPAYTPAGPEGWAYTRTGAVGSVTPLDIAPTVLHAAGLAVGTDMPGRVIHGLLPEPVAARAERRARYEDRPGGAPAPGGTRHIDATVAARLQALGYVGSVESSLARQNLGEIFYRRGNFAAAERELRAAVESQPQNLNAHLWLAKTLRARGRAAEALKAYERAIGLPGDTGEALVEMADLAVAARSGDQASRILLAVRPANAAARSAVHTARGIIAHADGRTSAAERELKAAIAAEPLAFEPLSRLADLLIAGRRAKEAMAIVKTAAAAAPRSPRHLALLGETSLAAGDASSAEAAFAGTLRLAPDSAAVRLGLGRAQITRQKPAEALTTLEPAPESAERSMLLGAAYSSLGRWPDAVRQLQQALDTTAPTPHLLNSLGWAHYKLGRTQEASALLQRSLALDGNQPEIRRLLEQIRTARRRGSGRVPSAR